MLYEIKVPLVQDWIFCCIISEWVIVRRNGIMGKVSKIDTFLSIPLIEPRRQRCIRLKGMQKQELNQPNQLKLGFGCQPLLLDEKTDLSCIESASVSKYLPSGSPNPSPSFVTFCVSLYNKPFTLNFLWYYYYPRWKVSNCE